MTAQTINASPARVNVKGLVLGDSLVREIVVRGGNYSTYTFASKVRLSDGTTKSFSIGTPTFDGTDTRVVITLAATDSVALTAGAGHDWDVQWTDGDGKIRTLIRGVIRTFSQVT